MDPTRFDAIARSLGTERSRRRVLKTLGAAALGALGVASARRGTGAAPGGNSACAHFCQTAFPPGPQRGQCVSDAAQGTGLCYECGPASDGSQAFCGGKCNGAVNAVCQNDNQCCSGQCDSTGKCCPSCPGSCMCGSLDSQGLVCINAANLTGSLCETGPCPGGQVCYLGFCVTLCTPLA